MFAVRDKRTKKFLKTFSGSFNHAESNMEWRLFHKKHPESSTLDCVNSKDDPSAQEVHDAMFCLKTANGAKIYKTRGAIAASFYSYRGRDGCSLEEALPWLEIVPIKISLK